MRDVRHGRGSRGSMIGEGQGVRLTPEGLKGSSGGLLYRECGFR